MRKLIVRGKAATNRVKMISVTAVKSGEGYLDVLIKILITVIIGAALLAFGIQLSIDYGYGGAIYLKAKTTQLREHYMRNYGAIPFSRFDPFLLLIDGDAARELFGQYLKEV